MPLPVARLLRDGLEALAENAISYEHVGGDHGVVRVLGVPVFDTRWRERRLRRRAKLRALRAAARRAETSPPKPLGDRVDDEPRHDRDDE